MTGESPITLYSPAPGLTQTISSYLYEEYADDDDLQGFVAAYNQLAQQYVNWFVQVILPVWSNPNVIGLLLDWVARGIYGYAGRPQLLVSGSIRTTGPYNTFLHDTKVYDGFGHIGQVVYAPVTDDIFKRVLTWNMYRGDGPYFTVRWLKRRIMRFLFGTNGTDTQAVATSPQVSVSFGTSNEVSITFITVRRKFFSGALYGRFLHNRQVYDALFTTATFYPPVPYAMTLKAAIDAKVCVLPFIYTFIVVVQQAISASLMDDGGVLLIVGGYTGYPNSPTGVPPGGIWSNGGVVQVVPPTSPNPSAPPVFFGITAAQLINLGGSNLPLTPPTSGSGQLWNNLGVVMVA